MLERHWSRLTRTDNGEDHSAWWSSKLIHKVDITETAHWLYEEQDKKHSLTYDFSQEYPTIASPWPLAWFEFFTPSHVLLNGQQCRWEEMCFIPRGHVGFVYSMFPTDHGDENASLIKARFHVTAGTDAKWHVIATVYSAIRNGCIRLGWVQGLLGTSGRLLAGTQLLVAGDPDTAVLVDMRADLAMKMISRLTDPLWFALSLLHCKNVHIEDIPIAPKVTAKRVKRGIPQITYKTLVVEPMRQQIRRQRDADPHGEPSTITRALHICRGHFATYSTEAPLFGKHIGTYWRPMHVRGTSDAGEVRKDYEIRR